MRTWALVPLMVIGLSACDKWPTPSASAPVDRLRQPASEHAQALAGDDVEAMRETGLALLSLLTAYAGWK